jgi:tetratricopeptide (TPR) repeat protein
MIRRACLSLVCGLLLIGGTTRPAPAQPPATDRSYWIPRAPHEWIARLEKAVGDERPEDAGPEVLLDRIWLAHAYRFARRMDDALDQVVRVAPRLGRLRGADAVLAYATIGEILAVAGFIPEAVDCLQKSLAVTDASEAPPRRARRALRAIDLSLEIDRDDEARAWLRSLDRTAVSPLEVTIREAALLLADGRPSAARTLLASRLAEHELTRDPITHVRAVTRLAEACRRLGAYDAAVEQVERVLNAPELGRNPAAPECRRCLHEDLGRTYRCLNRPVEAIAHLKQAELSVDPDGRATDPDPGPAIRLAWLLLEQGDREEALRRLDHARALLREGYRLDRMWQALFVLTRIGGARGEPALAWDDHDLYERAIRALEHFPASRGEREGPITPRALYAPAIELAGAMAHLSTGGGMLERAASWLAGYYRRTRPTGPPRAPRVGNRLLDVSLAVRLLDPGLDRLAQEALRKRRIALGVPRMAPPIDPLAVIRRALGNENDVAFLYFAARKNLLGLAVTRDRIGFERIPGTAPEWDDRVRRFRLVLQGTGIGRDAVPGGLALYRALVAPLLDAVGAPGVRRLLIVPDGPLTGLPFSALAPPEHPAKTWLGFVSGITYFPDVESMRSAAEPVPAAGPARIVGVASPSGEVARDRAMRIAAHGGPGSQAVLGEEATPERLEAVAREARPDVLHLLANVRPAATSQPVRDAADAGIGLSGGRGRFTFDRMAALRLENLVVVAPRVDSAPEPAARFLAASRSFLAAGARSVLTVRWPIEPRVADRFLGRFYRHLGEGRTLGQALLATRREFSRSPGIGGPATWAAFDLAGDDRRTLIVREPFRWFSLWWGLALATTLIAGYRLVRVIARATVAGREN